MMMDSNITQERFNRFVIIENLICAGVVFTTCTGRANITSLIFAVSFVVLVIGFVTAFMNRPMKSLDMLVLLIITLAGINVMINALLKSGDFNFEYLKSYIIFASTSMLFSLSAEVRLNRRTCDWMFLIQIVICLIYIYTYHFVPNYSTITMGLTLNFSNPNLTGMFLLQSALFMSIGILYFRTLLLKLICAFLAIIMLKYTVETSARNALISFALFLIITLFYTFKRGFKLPKWLSVILNCVPILFVPIYLSRIEFIAESGWFDFLISEGKNLYSRVWIWNAYFDAFDNSWLIGNYAECMGNAHNAHLVVLFSYGILVLLLVIVLNSLITEKLSKGITHKFQGAALAAFFAAIFMGIGEGALYSGGVGLYIFPAMFIMLANSDFVEKT